MKQTTYTLVAATSTLIAAADNRRGYLAILNRGAGDADIGLGEAAVAGAGWPLYAGGGGFTWTEQKAFAPVGEVYAISTAGTTLVVMEG